MVLGPVWVEAWPGLIPLEKSYLIIQLRVRWDDVWWLKILGGNKGNLVSLPHPLPCLRTDRSCQDWFSVLIFLPCGVELEWTSAPTAQSPFPWKEWGWGSSQSQPPPINVLGAVTWNSWVSSFCPEETARSGLQRERKGSQRGGDASVGPGSVPSSWDTSFLPWVPPLVSAS